MKYKAVIFDLFGTLIDKFSLKEHTLILRQMAAVITAPADDFVRLWFDTFDMRGLGKFQSLETNILSISARNWLYIQKTTRLGLQQIRPLFDNQAILLFGCPNTF